MKNQNTNAQTQTTKKVVPTWEKATKVVENFAFDAEEIITTAHEAVDQKIEKIFDLIPGEVVFRGRGITIAVYTYAMIVAVKLDAEDKYHEVDILGDINPKNYPGSPHDGTSPALLADLFREYAEKIDDDVREYMREHTCMCYRCKVHYVGLNICPQNCERLGI